MSAGGIAPFYSICGQIFNQLETAPDFSGVSDPYSFNPDPAKNSQSGSGSQRTLNPDPQHWIFT